MSNDYHGRYLTPPGGWSVGPAEEPPASIPARPYDDEPGPVDFVRLGERLDAVDFTAAHDSVVRPEIADALQAAACEDLIGSAVVNLNDLAATDPAAFYRALDTQIAKAAAAIPPGYDIAVSCDPVGSVFDSNQVAFKITGTPRAEPVTLDDIVEMMNRISLDTCPMPERIKLTREQMDALPKAWPPRYANGMIVNLFDVPVELVETVEESTPYQWQHAQPGPLRFDRDLSDDELAELRRRFEEACTDTRLRVVDEACAQFADGRPLLDDAYRQLDTMPPPEPAKPRARVVPTGPPFPSLGITPEPRRSTAGRIWQRLTRWAR